MAKEILMPRQGNTVESCLILEWHKQEGDRVEVGDVLCEVETDKAAFEVESEESGMILKLLYPAGEDVAVLRPIAIVGDSGEDISDMLAAAKDPDASPQEAPAVKEAVVSEPEHLAAVIPDAATVNAAAGRRQAVSPRARRVASAKGLDPASVTGSGPEGRVIERDVLAALGDQAPLSPAAKAVLLDRDWQAPEHGSGIGGRVMTADLQSAPNPCPAQAAAADSSGAVTDIPVKGVRKIIASRMLDSLQSTAQLTINASADASALLAYRKRLKQSNEELGLSGITINDFVLYAIARTLPQFPFMNAHFLGETIREFANVHLGMAVDSERGLLVPVIKNADRLALKALSGEAKRLGAAAKSGAVSPDDLSGASFTMTNLGALGIESFTPVLNPPEVAILGVCAIQPKPVLDGDDVTYRPHINLSLTFDHRAVDGAPAARFLKALCTALADFDLLLAG
ncbi:dihydrolipoyllysine acetyltransferase [candidate division KSB3 bacterium]|uniref:Dihydrolipoamide acetyltransferase component of pyruvate dehydrogenase complex n=1 Tax=candidate division KSB3 bacterium TaxID=2044937 RepID=A0A2G6E246_9BACT|nr:MAG: dihydrolipoyllysine acetyltransferase [candidate division KSB3 bacterium]PIE28706.1 MAG: dihydrolipoyllysine acetyltransferase [candidate division KSB3 bacterium]